MVHKRSLLLLAPLLLTACGQSKPKGCPELTPMLSTDPVEEARSAWASGDRSILQIGGPAPSTPGAEGSKAMPRDMPGTGEGANQGCPALRADAVRYATAFNRKMVALEAAKPGR